MNSVFHLIKKHSSLLIIVLGAGCFFFSNIILQSKLNGIDYGVYSLFVTYLSFIYIYGLLGFEQVLLRYSFVKSKNLITTQKINKSIILSVILFTSIGFSILFRSIYFQSEINYLLLFITSLSVIISMPIFSILRLNEQFSFAQLVANYWKIILIVICGLIVFFNNYSINFIITTLSISIIIFSIIVLIYFFKTIQFQLNKDISNKTIFQSFLFFFISITSFSLITFGDRFIIEYKINIETLGIYFFLFNFLLAPFNILQNYIGFKQLVEYKKGINFKIINRNIIQTIVLGLSLGIILFAISYVLEEYEIIDFEFHNYSIEIILLLILGIVKLYSSIISPAFEVTTDIKMLKTFNIILILSTLIIIAILLLINQLSITVVILTLIILWLIRSLVQHYLIYNSNTSNS